MNNQNTNLLQAPFKFALIDSNFEIWEYLGVSKGDALIVLRELNLTSADVRALAGTTAGVDDVVALARLAHDRRTHAARPAVSARGACGRDVVYWEIYEQAKEEFEKNGRIEGFEVLNPRTFQKLWVSHFDLEVLNQPS